MTTINPIDYQPFYQQAGEKDGVWVELDLYDTMGPGIQCYQLLPEVDFIASFEDQEIAIEFVQNYFNN